MKGLLVSTSLLLATATVHATCSGDNKVELINKGLSVEDVLRLCPPGEEDAPAAAPVARSAPATVTTKRPQPRKTVKESNKRFVIGLGLQSVVTNDEDKKWLEFAGPSLFVNIGITRFLSLNINTFKAQREACVITASESCSTLEYTGNEVGLRLSTNTMRQGWQLYLEANRGKGEMDISLVPTATATPENVTADNIILGLGYHWSAVALTFEVGSTTIEYDGMANDPAAAFRGGLNIGYRF
jgi:hypothetical protein